MVFCFLQQHRAGSGLYCPPKNMFPAFVCETLNGIPCLCVCEQSWAHALIFLWTSSAGLHCAILVPQLTTSWVCTRLSSWCRPSTGASYLATSHSPTQIHPALPVGISPLSHLVSLVLLHIRLLLPLKLALTALWELEPLVGVAVIFGWNCAYLIAAHLHYISVLSLSLTVCSWNSEAEFNCSSELMMKSNAILGITVTLRELLMLLSVCLCWSLVVSDARSADIVILISWSSLLNASLLPPFSFI